MRCTGDPDRSGQPWTSVHLHGGLRGRGRGILRRVRPAARQGHRRPPRWLRQGPEASHRSVSLWSQQQCIFTPDVSTQHCIFRGNSISNVLCKMLHLCVRHSYPQRRHHAAEIFLKQQIFASQFPFIPAMTLRGRLEWICNMGW